MDALTPASADDLPPLGELVADDPFWRYPAWGLGGKASGTCASGRLRPLLRATWPLSPRPASDLRHRVRRAHLGRAGPQVRALLVLLEHYLAPELGEGTETLNLVRFGADGSPHWSRVWPTPEDNPRHAGLELWMTAYGHQIVSRPASAFDFCEDEGD